MKTFDDTWVKNVDKILKIFLHYLIHLIFTRENKKVPYFNEYIRLSR